MHSFEVHSNESACRKSGQLGLEQVIGYPNTETFQSMGPQCELIIWNLKIYSLKDL